MQIVIISGSVRTGRKSDRVATYFDQYIRENNIANVKTVDLLKLNFPVFDERLKFQNTPTPEMLEFAATVTNADGIIIITPEYNGGYPASLKNAVDLLYSEWQGKPVAIVSVSNGPFGGTQVLQSFQFVLFKMGVWTVPVMYPVANVEKAFDENGVPSDKETSDKFTAAFLKKLLWYMEANAKMKRL